MGKRKILLALFLLLLLLHCFSIQFELNQIRAITKLLLVPFLILHLIINYSFKSTGYLPIIALLFSWAGDVLLLESGAIFFLSGMTAFVITHILYSISFLKINPLTPKSRSYFIYPFIVLLIISVLVFLYLKNYLVAP